MWQIFETILDALKKFWSFVKGIFKSPLSTATDVASNVATTVLDTVTKVPELVQTAVTKPEAVIDVIHEASKTNPLVAVTTFPARAGLTVYNEGRKLYEGGKDTVKKGLSLIGINL